MKKLKYGLLFILALWGTMTAQSTPYTGWEGEWSGGMGLAISHNDSLIVSGGNDMQLRIWDYDSGNLIKTIPFRRALVSVKFSANDSLMAVGMLNDSVLIYKTDDWTIYRKFPGGGEVNNSISISSDNNRIAVVNKNYSIDIWNINTGELENTLLGHSQRILGVDFSPSGDTLVSASFDNVINFWNRITGSLIHTINESDLGIYSVEYSMNGESIIVGNYGTTVSVYRVVDRVKTDSFYYETAYSATFSPINSNIIAAGGHLNTIRVWDRSTDLLLADLNGHTSMVRTVRFNHDGSRLLSISYDGTIKLWNTSSWNLLNTLTGHTAGIKSSTLSIDGAQLIASGGYILSLWNVSTESKVRDYLGYNTIINSVDYSPDGQRFIAGCYDYKSIIWNVNDLNPQIMLIGHTAGVNCVRFSDDGSKVVSASDDNTAIIWNATTGDSLVRLVGHRGRVGAVTFTPDGNTVITGSNDSTIRLWNVSNGGLLATLSGHNSAVTSLDRTEDGTILVSGSGDSTAKLWNISNPSDCQLIRTLANNSGTITGVRFSHDNKTLAITNQSNGAMNSSIKVYDVSSGNLIKDIALEDGWSNSLNFSPDDKQIIATGGGHNNFRIYDTPVYSSVPTDIVLIPPDNISCNGDCTVDTLFVQFNKSDYLSGKIVLSLPQGLEADWGVDTQHEVLPPADQKTSNLVFSRAKRYQIGSPLIEMIELNTMWGPGSTRSVSDQLYCAAIPIRLTDGSHGDTMRVNVDHYQCVNWSGRDTSGFTVTNAEFVLDCSLPTAEIKPLKSCLGFSDSSDFIDVCSLIVIKDSTSSRQLHHAYLVINQTDTVYLFNTPTDENFRRIWPVSDSSAYYWNKLTHICNSIQIFASYDQQECNYTTDSIVIVRDTAAPLIYKTIPVMCFNNDSTTNNYGGSYLTNQFVLTINAQDDSLTSCYSALSEVFINPVSTPETLAVSDTFLIPAISDSIVFPDTTNTRSFWDWIVALFPNSNGKQTFQITAVDCAGNTKQDTFDLCVDVVKPDNTFSLLDAQPADRGVWLKWKWMPDSVNATHMEIWRKGEGDYPRYDSLYCNAMSYYQNRYFSLTGTGWTKVCEQDYPDSLSAQALGSITNGFWFDRDSTWSIEGDQDDEKRDIYRYVSFIRDCSGNWSDTSFTLLTNADRSTNYFLGDFSMDSLDDPEASTGVVDSVDEAYIDQDYYFSSTVANGGTAPNNLDIGPVLIEKENNVYGKDIPNPDGIIDFEDLVVFSYNFGTINPPNRLAMQQITSVFKRNVTDDSAEFPLAINTDNDRFKIGQILGCDLSLDDTTSYDLKGLEVIIKYNSQALQYRTTDFGLMNSASNRIIRIAKTLPDKTDELAVAMAAIGSSESLRVSDIIATVNFMIKDPNTGQVPEIVKITAVDMTGKRIEIRRNGAGQLTKLPVDYKLYPNYPNPFNPVTQIRFDLPAKSNVKLQVFNLFGQLVMTLADGIKEPGRYTVSFDGKSLASGVYFYRLQTAYGIETRKMLLIK